MPAALSPDFSEIKPHVIVPGLRNLKSAGWGVLFSIPPFLDEGPPAPLTGDSGLAGHVFTQRSLSAAFSLNLKHVLVWSQSGPDSSSVCRIFPLPFTSFQNFLDYRIVGIDSERREK